MIINKIICDTCNWHGLTEEVDKVSDPKGDDIWIVCPQCRTPEHLIRACEHKDCWKEVSMGTPTKDGYKHTCYKHRPI